MIFLVDESVEREIVDALRANGHDVAYVAEMAPGIADDEVLAQANSTSAILITSDKDFGELVFRQKWIHRGVVLLRLHGHTADVKAMTVVAVAADFGDQLAEAFSVVSSGMVRIRHRLS